MARCGDVERRCSSRARHVSPLHQRYIGGCGAVQGEGGVGRCGGVKRRCSTRARLCLAPTSGYVRGCGAVRRGRICLAPTSGYVRGCGAVQGEGSVGRCGDVERRCSSRARHVSPLHRWDALVVMAIAVGITMPLDAQHCACRAASGGSRFSVLGSAVLARPAGTPARAAARRRGRSGGRCARPSRARTGARGGPSS